VSVGPPELLLRQPRTGANPTRLAAADTHPPAPLTNTSNPAALRFSSSPTENGVTERYPAAVPCRNPALCPVNVLSARELCAKTGQFLRFLRRDPRIAYHGAGVRLRCQERGRTIWERLRHKVCRFSQPCSVHGSSSIAPAARYQKRGRPGGEEAGPPKVRRAMWPMSRGGRHMATTHPWNSGGRRRPPVRCAGREKGRRADLGRGGPPSSQRDNRRGKPGSTTIAPAGPAIQTKPNPAISTG